MRPCMICGKIFRKNWRKSKIVLKKGKWKEKLIFGKKCHIEAMFRMIGALREAGHEGFMIGASGCSLCKPCAMAKGEPCRFPSRRYSCMSAYCIYVKKLAEECGIRYDYVNGSLPYFGTFIFR